MRINSLEIIRLDARLPSVSTFLARHDRRFSVREQFRKEKRGMTLSAGSLASFHTVVDLSERIFTKEANKLCSNKGRLRICFNRCATSHGEMVMNRNSSDEKNPNCHQHHHNHSEIHSAHLLGSYL